MNASINATVPQGHFLPSHVTLPHQADSGPVALAGTIFENTILSPPSSSKDRCMPSQWNTVEQTLDNLTGNEETQASAFINSTSKDVVAEKNKSVAPSGTYKFEKRLLKKMKEHWEEQMKDHWEEEMKERWEKEIVCWEKKMKERWGKEVGKAVDTLVELRRSLEEDVDVDL
ncbi:hypothetical protein MMC10_009836 [Thelotrema lepadinum]|nr:hypothetical protein [Thelotrema lepadinum]